MSRIRVYNKALGKYGTIDESDYDPSMFEKAPDLLKETVSNIPVVGGLLAPIDKYKNMVMGAGFEGLRGLGSLAGKDVYGVNATTGKSKMENPFLSEENLNKFSNPVSGAMEGAGTTGNAMLTAAMLWGLPGMIKSIPTIAKSIWKPSTLVGKLRGLSLKGKDVATPALESGVKSKLATSKFYQQAPEATKLAAEQRTAEFLRNLNPLETSQSGAKILQQPNTLLNKVYENLSPFEKMGKAYTTSGEPGGTALGQATNLVSHATRQYMNENIPATTKGLNDLYAIMSKMEGARDYGLRYLPHAGIAAAGYLAASNLINKIFGKN